MRPGQSDGFPELATRCRWAVVRGDLLTDLEKRVLVLRDGRPDRGARAVRIAGFSHSGPISDERVLNRDIGLARTVLAAPSEEVWVLDRMQGAVCAFRRIVVQEVGEQSMRATRRLTQVNRASVVSCTKAPRGVSYALAGYWARIASRAEGPKTFSIALA